MADSNAVEAQSSIDPLIMKTVADDGTAEITVSVDSEDHRFEVVASRDHVEIDHIETLSYRGTIRTSTPSDEVYDLLVDSDAFSEYLEANDFVEGEASTEICRR